MDVVGLSFGFPTLLLLFSFSPVHIIQGVCSHSMKLIVICNNNQVGTYLAIK